ncbi:hypothetical protein D3C73_1402440 [compost metagenome]
MKYALKVDFDSIPKAIFNVLNLFVMPDSLVLLWSLSASYSRSVSILSTIPARSLRELFRKD